jgi:hypothetical protein
MQRTDLQDTALWAHRAKIQRLRAMTPEQRLRQLFDRIEAGRQIEKLARERRSTT